MIQPQASFYSLEISLRDAHLLYLQPSYVQLMVTRPKSSRYGKRELQQFAAAFERCVDQLSSETVKKSD